MNNFFKRTDSQHASRNALFLKAAISALQDNVLKRINDTPAFNAWPESSKALLHDELNRRLYTEQVKA